MRVTLKSINLDVKEPKTGVKNFKVPVGYRGNVTTLRKVAQ
jgi:hypothetical protein